jgi:transcriptional regulator with XRE-family HTH domain
MGRHSNTFRVNTQGVRHTSSSWPRKGNGTQTRAMSRKKLDKAGVAAKKTQEGVLAGERIRAARVAKGWSQDDLADATNGKLGGRRIGNWEQGTREVGIQEGKILQDALGEPAAYLMGLIDEVDRELLALSSEAKKALLATARAMRGTSDGKTSVDTASGKAIPKEHEKPEGRPKEIPDLPARLRRSRRT